MKVLVTADWHLSNGLPHARRDADDLRSDRLNDLVTALDWIISSAVDRQMPLIILGDVFDRRKPDAVTLKTAATLFRGAAEAGLRVYILPGNHDAHDTRGLHYVVETFSLAGIEGITVLEAGTTYDIGGLVLCPVPYQSRKATLELIEEYRAIKFKFPKVLLIHDTVVGTRMSGGYIAEEGVAKDDLKGFDYVLAGHVHEFQKLKPIRGAYIGSPFQMNFNEVYHEPSIGQLSTEGRKATLHRIKVPPELSCQFAETVMSADGKAVMTGPIDAPYYRLLFEGDDEALEVRRPEIEALLEERKRRARSADLIHRGGPSASRGRLGIDMLAEGLPPMEDLIADYARLHREDDADPIIAAGLDILGGLS